MPPDSVWGQMTDAFVLVTIAAILGVTLFVFASLSSIRALDSLCTLVQEKRPDQWATRGDYGWRMMLCGLLFITLLAAVIWFSGRMQG
jgi:ABC-type phosphate transport system permease subunit